MKMRMRLNAFKIKSLQRQPESESQEAGKACPWPPQVDLEPFTGADPQGWGCRLDP